MKAAACIWTLALILAVQGAASEQGREASTRYRNMAFEYLAWVQSNPKPEYLPRVEDLISGNTDEQILVVAIRTIPGLVKSGADAYEAVDMLVDLYDDADSQRVKRSALIALSSIKTLDAFDVLLGVAEGERDERMRGRAFWAMRRLTGCDYPDVLMFWYRWREGQGCLSREVMTEIESGERDRILAAMASATQLALPSPGLLDLVASFLYDPDPTLREGACKTLAVHNKYPSHVRTRLLEMAERDADEGVRKAALAALGKVEQEEQRPVASR